MEASNSLFWQLHVATSKGQISGLLRKMKPSTGEQVSNSRIAWQTNLNFFENNKAKRARIQLRDYSLKNLVYDGKNGTTITGCPGCFEEIHECLTELGESVSEHKRYEALKDGIIDRSYYNFKTTARQCRWSYAKFVEELERKRELQVCSITQRRQFDKGTNQASSYQLRSALRNIENKSTDQGASSNKQKAHTPSSNGDRISDRVYSPSAQSYRPFQAKIGNFCITSINIMLK